MAERTFGIKMRNGPEGPLVCFGRIKRDPKTLKLFMEEEDLHFYVVLDTSASMDFGTPTKLEYAKQLAAALCFVGLVRADRVKVETLSPGKLPSPILRGRRSTWRLFDYLKSD